MRGNSGTQFTICFCKQRRQAFREEVTIELYLLEHRSRISLICELLWQAKEAFCLDYLLAPGAYGSKAYADWRESYKYSSHSREGATMCLPDPRFMTIHDTLLSLEDACVCPRVLQPFRMSAPKEAVSWGNGDGNYAEVTIDNFVRTSNCCLMVDVDLSTDLTIEAVLGFNLFEYLESGWIATNMTACPKDWKYLLCWYSAVGELFFSRLRPQNVFHPHLRAHVEFHAGLLLGKEFSRRSTGSMPLATFLASLGINFAPTSHEPKKFWGSSKSANADHASTYNLFIHTSWGERVSPCMCTEDGGVYLLHSVCPFMDIKSKPCSQHLAVAGMGTLCNQYHPLEKKYGQALKAHAQTFLGLSHNQERGTWNADIKFLNRPGFGRLKAEACGFVFLGFESYHHDPRQKLQLFGLPRFVPKLLVEQEREQVDPTELCTYMACQEYLWKKSEWEKCNACDNAVRQAHIDFAKLVEKKE